MMLITAGDVQAATGAEVEEELRDLALHSEISDATAKAIAGWFASPAPEDMAFTRLAQGQQVDVCDLQEAILTAFDDEGLDSQGECYLVALSGWVRAVTAE